MLKKIYIIISEILRSYYFKKTWRKHNKHNYTNVNKLFPIEIVTVGKYSYGTLNVNHWGNAYSKLIIGSFVSIAPNVSFLLDGNHNTDTFSTYPFKVKIIGEQCESLSKGEIRVEDDVWIGMNSTILSGVKIGKGAIIAAGSVVVKDVAPYSIVGGNPAKLIKLRFSNDIIDLLKEVNFDKINDNFIRENIEDLYKPVDLLTLKILKKKLDEVK